MCVSSYQYLYIEHTSIGFVQLKQQLEAHDGIVLVIINVPNDPHGDVHKVRHIRLQAIVLWQSTKYLKDHMTYTVLVIVYYL